MEDNKERKLFRLKPFIIVLVIGVIIGIGAVFFLRNKPGRVTTISESALKDIFEINELSTVEYIYNSVTEIYDESGEKLIGHIAYEGTVTAGVKDFSAIDIKQDEKSKIIKVMIPDVEIIDCNVDAGTMDYIFVKEKFNDETVPMRAYQICIDDLKNKAETDSDIMVKSKENTLSVIKAMIEPWVKQVDPEYEIEYGFKGDET